MENIFTERVLGALIKAGYCYFLCKSSSAQDTDVEVNITLRPVKRHPLLSQLPDPYQRYYGVSQELLQLSKGLPRVRVSVELKGLPIHGCLEHHLNIA